MSRIISFQEFLSPEIVPVFGNKELRGSEAFARARVMNSAGGNLPIFGGQAVKNIIGSTAAAGK